VFNSWPDPAGLRTGSEGIGAVGGLSTVQPSVTGRVPLKQSSHEGSWAQTGHVSQRRALRQRSLPYN